MHHLNKWWLDILLTQWNVIFANAQLKIVLLIIVKCSRIVYLITNFNIWYMMCVYLTCCFYLLYMMLCTSNNSVLDKTWSLQIILCTILAPHMINIQVCYLLLTISLNSKSLILHVHHAQMLYIFFYLLYHKI